MIDLLFNSNFWYTLIVIAAAVLIFIACLKYPAGKYFIGTVILIVAVGATIYCGTQLYYYYDTKGATFGTIDIDEPNKVNVDDFRFNFQNFELKQVSGDEYSAEAHLSEILELDENKTYGIFINETPCDLTQYSSNYLNASYSYTFRDDDLTVLMEDTLQINFAFNATSTDIKITTYNGAEAVKYWNNYFNKNTIVITIEEIDYMGGTDITFGDGEFSNYNVLTYLVNDVEYTRQAYQTGSKIVFPQNPENGNLYFAGWKIGNEFVNTSYIVRSNETLTAVFENTKTFTITFIDGENVTTQRVEEGQKINFPQNENIEGWVENYTKNDGTLNTDYIDISNITATSNKTYYAIAWRDVEIINGEIDFGFSTNLPSYFELTYQDPGLFNDLQIKFDLTLKFVSWNIQVEESFGDVTQTFNIETSTNSMQPLNFYVRNPDYIYRGTPVDEVAATVSLYLGDGKIYCDSLSVGTPIYADSSVQNQLMPYFTAFKISNFKALY